MVGFNTQNSYGINLLYICPSCSLILREPFQLSCGHRQCKTCIENIAGDIVKCSECQEDIPINEIMRDRGCTNDMQLIPIACSLCEWNGLYKDYEEHLKQTHEQLICQDCGQIFSSTDKRNEHNTTKCLRIIISRPVVEYTSSNRLCHSQSLDNCACILHADTAAGMSDSLQDETPSEIDICTRETLPMSTLVSATINADDLIEEISKTIDFLLNAIQTLNNDIQRRSDESIRLQTSIESAREDFESLQRNLEEEDSSSRSIMIQLEILREEVASLKGRVDELQNVSYDGTLIWKITNFEEKMRDAQSERQTSIYSPPFYSTPTGYKMRARLYLNGDGNARRTHMSLFFVLMRGRNDSILKFPFNYKVTFCLFDQTPQLRHIIDSFRPDIRSSSFQRPQSEMNIASGIPKFFPLAMIQQKNSPYVLDNTMSIKVMVGFGDMPKTLLPYALSLNPGLPTNVQHDLIRGEAERRTQTQTSSSQQ